MRVPPKLHFLQPDQLKLVSDWKYLAEGSHRRCLLLEAVARDLPRIPSFRLGRRPVPRRPLRVTGSAVHHSVLHNAMVIGRGVVADAEGGLLIDSVSGLGKGADNNLAAHVAAVGLVWRENVLCTPAWCRGPPVAHIREPLFHLLNGRDQNYTHFLFEVLPKLVFRQAMPAPRPRLLVSAAVARSFGWLFSALGVGEDEMLVAPEAGWLRVDEIHVAGEPGWQHQGVMRALRDLVAGETPVDRARIYIRRIGTKAWARPLLNETAVIERLVARGFRIIVPESLPREEQMAVMRSADVIAGVYGGGLLNSLFCPPGTKVLTLTSTGYWRSSLDSAANSLDLRVVEVVGDCFLARHDPNNSAFVLDLDALDAACDALDL